MYQNQNQYTGNQRRNNSQAYGRFGLAEFPRNSWTRYDPHNDRQYNLPQERNYANDRRPSYQSYYGRPYVHQYDDARGYQIPVSNRFSALGNF